MSDPAHARFLTDPAKKAFFVPFLARERTVSEAADELGRQALFWSDSTLTIRDSDARRLGEQVRAWYDEAERLSLSCRGDPTARHYLCVAALLPSKPIRS